MQGKKKGTYSTRVQVQRTTLPPLPPSAPQQSRGSYLLHSLHSTPAARLLSRCLCLLPPDQYNYEQNDLIHPRPGSVWPTSRYTSCSRASPRFRLVAFSQYKNIGLLFSFLLKKKKKTDSHKHGQPDARMQIALRSWDQRGAQPGLRKICSMSTLASCSCGCAGCGRQRLLEA